MDNKKGNTMNGCPDDDMAAGVIATKLSAQQQSHFDNMALRGAHEYIAELETENESLRVQLATAKSEVEHLKTAKVVSNGK